MIYIIICIVYSKLYYNINSNIYILDASKGFDKIHFGKLFKTLISKKSPSFSDQINF